MSTPVIHLVNNRGHMGLRMSRFSRPHRFASKCQSLDVEASTCPLNEALSRRRGLARPQVYTLTLVPLGGSLISWPASVKLRGLERAPTHLRRSGAVLHCADDQVADRPQADHETRVCWAVPGLRNAHERFTQRSIPNREASPSTLAEYRLLAPAGVALDRPRAGIPSC